MVPVGERKVTVAPTLLSVPTTRKSPAFHFAVVIPIVSERGVTTT